MWLGIVDDFGDVITAWGFPLVHAIAWTITVVELTHPPIARPLGPAAFGTASGSDRVDPER